MQGGCCGISAGLLQRFAEFLCKTGARALNKSLIELLAKSPRLDGVLGSSVRIIIANPLQMRHNAWHLQRKELK
jgi:hypothetical protein